MLNQIEQLFCDLITHLKQTWTKEKFQTVQKEIKTLLVAEVPEEYRKSLSFYQSLSGSSQQLMWKLIKNPNTKKQYIKEKGKQRKLTNYYRG